MPDAPKGASRRPSLELADIVREHGDSFRRAHALTPMQGAALRAIERCRTAVLGGHLELCEACGYEHPVYNSCRNRHCPKCQCLAAERWIAAREARVLPTRHFHVVFTVPAELHALARYRPALVFDLLFAASAATLQELGRDEDHLGAEIGITSVLHTWTRELAFHPHVHCVVTGGGLSLDGQRWIACRGDRLFDVHVLGALYRGKMLDGIRRAHARGDFAGFDEFEDPEGFDRLMRRLAKHKRWNVYAKKTFRAAEHVFAYLGRYTHRVGIANSRLVSLVDGRVTFRTKNGKSITLDAVAFLARFVAHVLPPRFVKIRHYGLLAAGNVNTKLVRARDLLGGKAKSTSHREQLLEELCRRLVRKCPNCGAPLIRRPLPTQALARAPP
ncbi:MAG: IS91 family transposase [Polyangiaceae bacterium]